MKNIDIEICHIYGDQKFSLEHEFSIKKYKKFLSKIKNNNIQTNILIDDYNKELHLKKEDLISFFYQKEVKIDYIAFEKNFIQEAEYIISKIQIKNLKIETFRKENKKVCFLMIGKNKIPLYELKNNKIKYSCVILATGWLLYRFNKEKKPTNIYLSDKIIPDYLINILPIKYKKVEDQTILILEYLKLKEINKKIKRVYF